MKEHGTTKEEVEGSTSTWGLRNRITLLTLQEHDDDDDDDDDDDEQTKDISFKICGCVYVQDLFSQP